MDLPITIAVQQVAAKTRITTRRNILTPYLLQSVWPRCWVQLIWSAGLFSTLHVTRHLTRRYRRFGGLFSDRPVSGLFLYCRIHVLSLCLTALMIVSCTDMHLQIECQCVGLDRGKCKGKVKGFSKKSWRLRQGMKCVSLNFILTLAPLWLQVC
jgi:hypothetical protein